MKTLVFDAEVIPQDEATYTDAQKRRLDKEFESKIHYLQYHGKSGLIDFDVVRREVQTFHPMLGRICALAIRVEPASFGDLHRRVYFIVNDTQEDAKAVVDETNLALHVPFFKRPGETEQDVEMRMLKAFRKDIAHTKNIKTSVSFNGKKFDTDYVRWRFMVHEIASLDFKHPFEDTYPWGNKPHTDLINIFQSVHYGFDDLCDQLGIPSPKVNLSGGLVWEAYQDKRFVEIADYCMLDVDRTYECYYKLRQLKLISDAKK